MYFSLSISFIAGSVLIACLFDLGPYWQRKRPLQEQGGAGPHEELGEESQRFPWKKIAMNVTFSRMLVEVWRAQTCALPCPPSVICSQANVMYARILRSNKTSYCRLSNDTQSWY